MATNQLTLGEYMRRLRRETKKSLHAVSEETRISYTHLSRIENDATLPSADTVARVAEALNGDLKVMLELAGCLPRAILDRISAQDVADAQRTLHRSSGPRMVTTLRHSDNDKRIIDLAHAAGLDDQEAIELTEVVEDLARLKPAQRSALARFIRSLAHEDDETTD